MRTSVSASVAEQHSRLGSDVFQQNNTNMNISSSSINSAKRRQFHVLINISRLSNALYQTRYLDRDLVKEQQDLLNEPGSHRHTPLLLSSIRSFI